MTARILLSVGAIAASLMIFAVRPATGETLADAFIAAYQNSSLLESNRALLRSQDESVAAAVAALRPTVSAAASAESKLTRAPGSASVRRITDGALAGTLSLTVELLIADGGEGKLAIKAAREIVQAARQTLLDVEQAVLLNAAMAYHDVIRQSELLKLAENGFRVMENQLLAARGRFDLGEITRTDVSLVEARLAAAKGRLLLSQGELEIAGETYRLATGSYPAALAPLPPVPDIPATIDDARLIARQMHPSIVRAKHSVAAAQFNLKRTETISSPRVYLGGTVGATREVGAWSRGSDRAAITLSAVMPLYSGGKADSTIRSARANLERARFELQQAAKVAEQLVAIAWTRLEIAESSIETRELQAAATALAYEGVKAEAVLGLRTTLDVLDSEQELLSARNDLVAAKRDRDVAVYALLSSVGLLTVKHLGLGIPTYSPDDYFSQVASAPAETWPTTTIENLFQSLGMK